MRLDCRSIDDGVLRPMLSLKTKKLMLRYRPASLADEDLLT